MTKKEIREMLNSRGVTANIALHKLRDFVLEDENKAIIANFMVDELKKRKNLSNLDLFHYFYAATKQLVEGTKFCKNAQTAQTLLRGVWENSQFQNIIVRLVRAGYKHLPQKTSVKEEGTKESSESKETKTDKKTNKKDHKETEEERRERLVKQAERMRKAKAKKREEKLKKQKKKTSKKNKSTKDSKSPKQQREKQQKSKKEKELTPEEKEKIEMLRNMRT